LSEALKNVWFGDCRVWAREGGKESTVIMVKSEGIKNVRIAKQKEGFHVEGAMALRVGDVEVMVGGQEKVAKVRKVAVVGKNAGGDMVAEVSKSKVQVGEAKGMAGPGKLVRGGVKRREAGTSITDKVKKQQRSRYVPIFNSRSQDLKWAHSGMVATMSKEESALVIQQKVEDAGFPNVVVTPMRGSCVSSLY